MTETKERIMRLEQQILQHNLLAQYWLAVANTGVCELTDTRNGINEPLTSLQKKESALSSVMAHIHLLRDMGENLIELHKKL